MIDPKLYQVSPHYLPDKEPLWKNSRFQDSWLDSNNSLRGEITAVRVALEHTKGRRKALQTWEIDSIYTVVGIHFDHMQSHNHIFDFLMTTETNKRFCLHGKFEIQHEELAQKFRLIEMYLQDNMNSGTKLSDGRLLRHWMDYEEMALAHLADEEQVFLPLIHFFYTPEEYLSLCRTTAKNLESTELGSFIYFMGKNKFRREFMKQEGHWCLLWYLKFSKCLNLFEKKFMVNVNALTNGIRPKVCYSQQKEYSCSSALSASFHGSTSSYNA